MAVDKVLVLKLQIDPDVGCGGDPCVYKMLFGNGDCCSRLILELVDLGSCRDFNMNFNSCAFT